MMHNTASYSEGSELNAFQLFDQDLLELGVDVKEGRHWLCSFGPTLVQ